MRYKIYIDINEYFISISEDKNCYIKCSKYDKYTEELYKICNSNSIPFRYITNLAKFCESKNKKNILYAEIKNKYEKITIISKIPFASDSYIISIEEDKNCCIKCYGNNNNPSTDLYEQCKSKSIPFSYITRPNEYYRKAIMNFCDKKTYEDFNLYKKSFKQITIDDMLFAEEESNDGKHKKYCLLSVC